MHDAQTALKNTFYYSNAVMGGNEYSEIGQGLTGMINPNLDAALPVLLGISDSDSGHAIVADGYGYQFSTLYHHLNMGWAGQSDAWYNLPDVDASYSYNVVNACIYNVYMNGTGEIISGRITEMSAAPISGVVVTAQATTGGPTYTASTNNNGIYALVNLPSAKTYHLIAAKTSYGFLDQNVTTGSSLHGAIISGNFYGANFEALPSIPKAQNTNVQAYAGTHKTITLPAIDDGLPNPPGKLIYIIESLPQYGRITDPCGGIITPDLLPYTLQNFGKNVSYHPCAYFSGTDDFIFFANDGGTAPDGGDSDTATVVIDVIAPVRAAIYQTDFTGGLSADWSIIDDGSDGKTWTSTNPGDRTNPNWQDTFMIVDSFWAGNVSLDEQLITGNIDCSGFEQVYLNFSHYFRRYGTERGDVDISVDQGEWQNVARYYVRLLQVLSQLTYRLWLMANQFALDGIIPMHISNGTGVLIM